VLPAALASGRKIISESEQSSVVLSDTPAQPSFASLAINQVRYFQMLSLKLKSWLFTLGVSARQSWVCVVCSLAPECAALLDFYDAHKLRSIFALFLYRLLIFITSV
jgi:hypothetical protein